MRLWHTTKRTFGKEPHSPFVLLSGPRAGDYRVIASSDWPTLVSQPPTAGGSRPFCQLTTNSTWLWATQPPTPVDQPTAMGALFSFQPPDRGRPEVHPPPPPASGNVLTQSCLLCSLRWRFHSRVHGIQVPIGMCFVSLRRRGPPVPPPAPRFCTIPPAAHAQGSKTISSKPQKKATSGV